MKTDTFIVCSTENNILLYEWRHEIQWLECSRKKRSNINSSNTTSQQQFTIKQQKMLNGWLNYHECMDCKLIKNDNNNNNSTRIYLDLFHFYEVLHFGVFVCLLFCSLTTLIQPVHLISWSWYRISFSHCFANQTNGRTNCSLCNVNCCRHQNPLNGQPLINLTQLIAVLAQFIYSAHKRVY